MVAWGSALKTNPIAVMENAETTLVLATHQELLVVWLQLDTEEVTQFKYLKENVVIQLFLISLHLNSSYMMVHLFV